MLAYSSKKSGNVEVIGDGRMGGKGHTICNMARDLKGMHLAKIPQTKILATDVVADTASKPDELLMLLAKLRLMKGFLAVRSSAVCEDSCLVSCAGVFRTEFVRNEDDNLHAVAAAIQTVAHSSHSPGSAPFVAKNGLDGQMAVILQTIAGGRVSDDYYGPAYGGVLDTSSVNGKGNITLSIALGLGTMAVESPKSTNTVIVKHGHFAPRDIFIQKRQEHAEFLDKQGNQTKMSIDKALALLNFPSLDVAIAEFLKRYLSPLHVLSKTLEPHFAPSPLDLEFACTPNKGRRLYLLQARPSHLSRIQNSNYPQNVTEEQTLSVSRAVLGTTTVRTKIVANYTSKDYLADAENDFKSLLALDAMGEPYILTVPPEATSSDFKNLPIAQLRNLVFIEEKLTNEQVHEVGASGVDHMSRLLIDSRIGYMEGLVNFDKLKASSTLDSTLSNLMVYHGDFGAAVCGATQKGVFFLAK